MSHDSTDEASEAAHHPRPQFRRQEWLDLCGTWQFAFDDSDEGTERRWFDDPRFDATIHVPYPPESKLSEVHDPSFHPVLWYAREVEAPQLRADQRLLLHFGAVDYHATVWVNGEHVGEHLGGHTPFTFDITEALSSERERQLVVVRAEDQPRDASQPRGKQTTSEEPRGIWYDRTSGIWQSVWLETVPMLHMTGLRWTTDIENDLIHLDVTLNQAPATKRTVTVRLSVDGVLHTEQSATTSCRTTRVSIGIDSLRNGHKTIMWSPDAPNLVDAEVVLEADGGLLEDRAQSYLGLRSVGFRDGLFLLNGHPYYLRMVLEQGFWPESHLTAPSLDALRREVELIKRLGFNGVRIHQKIEDPRFLYWCDRLGLVVWSEFPAAFEYSPTAVSRTVHEWVEAVERDLSHPSIVAWVPLNESWGVPKIATSKQQQAFATAMYHLTKALDPTRLVISNDGWEHTISDIWSVHDYTPSGASIRGRYHTREAVHRTLYEAGPGRRKVMLLDDERAGQPVMITEFGGLSYAHELDGKWAGYATVDSSDELRDGVKELIDAITDSPEISGFCYTQLTDTQQERNGLLTEDREPKLPMDVLRAIISRPSRAIPAEDVDAYRRANRRAQDEKED
ncbi:glycoside hydrolase family 2 protein [Jiangella asiatica]|uniref:glycoside hydrolase family 2 protein n=1 Tax=Jiangella asiatica TaxID=2530372 RepID=UPI00193CBD3F|nr:sugar-binding domain-containing protein [Jiangella asiatica]